MYILRFDRLAITFIRCIPVSVQILTNQSHIIQTLAVGVVNILDIQVILGIAIVIYAKFTLTYRVQKIPEFIHMAKKS